MKASNILLTAILSFIFLASIGSNLILKSEYDKIDRNDQLSGYTRQALKPFKYVKLQGKSVGMTAIQQGDSYQLRMIVDKKYLGWKYVGDTLEVTFKRDWNGGNYGPDQLIQMTPSIYIIAPKISGVISEENNYYLRNWISSDISVRQNGGYLLLSDNSINNLTTQINSGGYFKIDRRNKIGKADIKLADSSALHIEKNVFESFHTTFDSTAVIDLPGSLIKKALVD